MAVQPRGKARIFFGVQGVHSGRQAGRQLPDARGLALLAGQGAEVDAHGRRAARGHAAAGGSVHATDLLGCCPPGWRCQCFETKAAWFKRNRTSGTEGPGRCI